MAVATVAALRFCTVLPALAQLFVSQRGHRLGGTHPEGLGGHASSLESQRAKRTEPKNTTLREAPLRSDLHVATGGA